jgi:hypothetical protein
MNYVHSTVNTVHLSRTAFNKGDEAAAQGRILAGRSRQLPATTATDRRLPSLCSPIQHHQDRRRSRAHPANGWWPRCWPSSPTAAASSPQRPAWTSVTSWGLGRSMGPHGVVPRSTLWPSRYWPSSRRARRPSASPHPRRSANLDLPLRWRARNRSSAGALGSPVVAGRCPIPQPSGRPPSRRGPPGRKPNERADLLGGLLCAGLKWVIARASRKLVVLDDVAHRRYGGDAVPRRRSRTWSPRCRGGHAGYKGPD